MSEFNQYDPTGATIEELMNRITALQSRMASTVSEVRREDGLLKEKQSQILQDIDLINLSVIDIETDVTGLSSNLSSLEIRADGIETNVSSLDTRVGSAESSITQNANNISSKVAQTDYNGNTIASLINQAATTITIAAEAIDLIGITNVNEILTIGDGFGTNARIIFNSNDSEIYTLAGSLWLSTSGNLGINANDTVFSGGRLDLSGLSSILWGTHAPSTATYATSAGNADTLDGYHASSFSFSGHSHYEYSLSGHDHGSAYIRPYTGQNLYLWRSGSEVRVYDGSGSYTRLTGTAF